MKLIIFRNRKSYQKWSQTATESRCELLHMKSVFGFKSPYSLWFGKNQTTIPFNVSFSMSW